MATNSPVDDFQSGIERARLEAFAVGAMVIADVVSERGVAFDHAARHLDGLIGGIVEYLDLQLLARIIDLADALHQPVDDVLLIEDGELNGDARQLGEVRRRVRHLVLAVLVIEVDELIAVHPGAGRKLSPRSHQVGNAATGLQ